MMKYKKGDRLANEKGYEREVLEVCGCMYFLSSPEDFKKSACVYTEYDVDNMGYTLKSRSKEDWTPEFGEKYYYM